MCLSVVVWSRWGHGWILYVFPCLIPLSDRYFYRSPFQEEHRIGYGEAEMEDNVALKEEQGPVYAERYGDVLVQMPERAERVFERLVERGVLPSPESSQKAPILTLELVREILATDRRLQGVPYEVSEKDEELSYLVGEGRRVVDVACVRAVILLYAEVNQAKVEMYERQHYFPERAKKVVGILRDRGVFPTGQEVYLSRELIRVILMEDMRLSQAGDIAFIYEVHPPRDEGEVERMTEEVWEYLNRQGVWKGRDLRESVESVDEVLYHSSMFLGEERREEWLEEQEQALQEDRRERHRYFLERLIRKGVVPDGEDKKVELTMHLIGELVFIGIEWAQREDESLHARYVEFWYVDMEARQRVYDVLCEEYGDTVHVDVDFTGRAFDAIEWRDTM